MSSSQNFGSSLCIFRYLYGQLGWLPFPESFLFCFRMAEFSCAVVAFVFYIVIFGQRGDFGSCSGQLPRFLQNNFRPAVVFLDLAVDLDHPALKLPDIAYALQVTRENDDRKRTQPEVVAEVQKVDPSRALFDAHDLA